MSLFQRKILKTRFGVLGTRMNSLMFVTEADMGLRIPLLPTNNNEVREPQVAHIYPSKKQHIKRYTPYKVNATPILKMADFPHHWLSVT